jgi:hypothetical protein
MCNIKNRVAGERPLLHGALIAFVLLFSLGCSGKIYLRDGVTDGDTFNLASRALSDPDPVLQSWVSYSLMKSTCQLQIGGDNPARNSSFECELTARRHLLQTWSEKQAENPAASDPYLDAMTEIQRAGYLNEYVVQYYRQRHWELPADLDMAAFRKWSGRNMRSHRPQTRIIGSWSFADR